MESWQSCKAVVRWEISIEIWHLNWVDRFPCRKASDLRQLAWPELDATSSWLPLTGRWLGGSMLRKLHPDPSRSIQTAGLWDKGCPSCADPAKVQRLQPEQQIAAANISNVGNLRFSIHSFSTHPADPADYKNDAAGCLPHQAACSPKTLEVSGGNYRN